MNDKDKVRDTSAETNEAFDFTQIDQKEPLEELEIEVVLFDAVDVINTSDFEIPENDDEDFDMM